MIARLAMVAALLGAGSGCTEPRSPACKKICKREAECIDKTASKLPFDEKECVAACAALERDADRGAAEVKRHYDCVLDPQLECPAVLDCR